MYGFLDYLTYAMMIVSHFIIMLVTILFAVIAVVYARDVAKQKRDIDDRFDS
ncbi:hypothetical protein V202x_28470 [Gimesia aquarii]|uniref:Uncharacterized protein n=1 Tax=Gimesia aquarii TaxID=2527964 RepID=A0A517WW85_9PLAN|nr:hypothetical protein V202x_28470 [Gimesia aquarii]